MKNIEPVTTSVTVRLYKEQTEKLNRIMNHLNTDRPWYVRTRDKSDALRACIMSYKLPDIEVRKTKSSSKKTVKR